MLSNPQWTVLAIYAVLAAATANTTPSTNRNAVISTQRSSLAENTAKSTARTNAVLDNSTSVTATTRSSRIEESSKGSDKARDGNDKDANGTGARNGNDDGIGIDGRVVDQCVCNCCDTTPTTPKPEQEMKCEGSCRDSQKDVRHRDLALRLRLGFDFSFLWFAISLKSNFASECLSDCQLLRRDVSSCRLSEKNCNSLSRHKSFFKYKLGKLP